MATKGGNRATKGGNRTDNGVPNGDYQMVTDPHLQFCKEKIDQTQLQ